MPLTRDQRRRRAHIERGIRLAAPALDLLLWVGDRFSRAIQRDDPGYDPPRPPAANSLGRGGSEPPRTRSLPSARR